MTPLPTPFLYCSLCQTLLHTSEAEPTVAGLYRCRDRSQCQTAAEQRRARVASRLGTYAGPEWDAVLEGLEPGITDERYPEDSQRIGGLAFGEGQQGREHLSPQRTALRLVDRCLMMLSD